MTRDNGDFAADWDRYAEQSRYFGAPHEVPGLESALAASSGTFVEVGCGDGNLLVHLSARGLLERFGRILAFDVSPERVERCRQLGTAAQFAVGDACDLAMPADSADFVLSDQVIEHVPDDRLMAREIARVLRSGGRAVVGSVTKAPWAWYFYRCNGRWVLDPTHVREYRNAPDYSEIFAGAGLHVESVTSRPVAFPLADLVLRVMTRSGLLRGSGVAARSGRSPLVRRLSKARLPLPGYRLIWAFLRKP